MNKKDLYEKVREQLIDDEVNYEQLAVEYGKAALSSLRKIAVSIPELSGKAQKLQEQILLAFANKNNKMNEKFRFKSHPIFMRKINVNQPDGHIKGFGSDMLRSPGKL